MTDRISMSDANDIAETILFRQKRWEGEPLRQSILVVLLNYGSKFVAVECVHREWRGVKGDLESRDGVPLCPNGHPLLETSGGKRLALVVVP